MKIFYLPKVLTIVKNSLFHRKQFCRAVANENVRVRFAPSPTGYIHLGGLRTALYNYLFAKSRNGTTILRIEDTDQTRKVEGAAIQIIEDLKWCGIEFDEGPYFQSERIKLYQKYASQLLDSGHAYYCFCSQTRLNLMRKEALKSGEIPKYDNKCRNLPKEDVAVRLANNETHCIRFKLTNAIVEYEDLIIGHHYFDVCSVEGDPIIIKSDGFPTYHLANVVDDHCMAISHVLRGSEWLTSTTKHLQLYNAFNWIPPQFGHLPLILNSDGTKFSKRQNDLKINYFKDSGIFPNTLINLVTRAGGGFDISKSERDVRNYSVNDFVKMFELSKLHCHSCRLPMEMLNECNRLEIKRLLNEPKDCHILIREVEHCVKNHFSQGNKMVKFNIDHEYILKVLDIVKDRIFRIKDLLLEDFIFLWTLPEYKLEETERITTEKIEEVINDLKMTDWNKDSLKIVLKKFIERHNLNAREFMSILRLMLTDKKDGPSVVEILDLLGKENALKRISISISR